MTNVLSLLNEVQEIKAIPVALPNGAETLAIKKRVVYLDSKSSLNNFLFVPDLNCNLMLIAQLIDDNIC